MKYSFAILLIICCFSLHAQKKNVPAETKGIIIGFSFSPDYNYRTLKNNEVSSTIDSIADLLIKDRNDREKPKFGYTTGLNVCINMTKFLDLETGIQYSIRGYQTRKYDLIYAQPDPNAPSKLKIIYNYYYINVPLKINLAVGNRNVRFISSAGLITNFLINATQKFIYEYPGGKTERKKAEKTDDFRKGSISTLISAGAECKLKDKMYLRIEPTFRYDLMKTVDVPIKEHLWNAGLNFGFYYRL